MKISTPQDLLEFWEQNYESLSSGYKERFLKHPAVKEILAFDTYDIKIAIKRNKKLAMALRELKNQRRKKEPVKIRVDKERWLPY